MSPKKYQGYRMFPIDNFLVFYVIENDEVQIHRFLYGKRDYLLIRRFREYGGKRAIMINSGYE